MTKSKNIIISSLLMFLSVQANAYLVQDYGGGLEWQYDDATRLQWLDLTYTSGLSIESALSTYAGWELATKDQYTDMISQYDFSDYTYRLGSPPTESYGVRKWTGGGMNYLENLFFKQFGITWLDTSLGDTRAHSYGFYDDAGIRRLGGLGIYDGSDSNPNYPDRMSLYVSDTLDYSGDWANPMEFVGQFLVRSVTGTVGTGSPNSNAVPEPSILALICLGILGLGFSRHKMKK